MTNLNACFSHKTVNVRTPSRIIQLVKKEFGEFDDPCPIGGTGGLDRNWGPVTYVNPPYGRETVSWVKKAVHESKRGKTIIMLLPARTDLAWFHDWILPFASDVRFIRGRLRFEGYKASAPFPSMLVIFKNTEANSK